MKIIFSSKMELSESASDCGSDLGSETQNRRYGRSRIMHTQSRQQRRQDVATAVFQRGSHNQIVGPRSVREQFSRIRSFTVSSRLRMNFFKGNVKVTSHFALKTPFYTSHPRHSLRYVVRWPRSTSCSGRCRRRAQHNPKVTDIKCCSLVGHTDKQSSHSADDY